ncbi:ABC-F family ATP-binding cassette domain-containing protein [Metallumcola ferriviriculae]|uniref:ABC-F family ATP-binding cassette domain-containing protein n=1 Tax=Metallumcola ferriviriculae TaxID=3039180 RepID=A0AAU0URF4_9FIRM|nr:ABC-F family ATP-binding cassette domain-containing protein [Desulfitibacteraceae bacterium MK1]
MILLQCSHTSKSFGSEVILHDVSLSVQTKERVGLVGANGAGKTTLLKIIGGQMESDHGQVSFAKDVQIGYLSQNSTPNSSRTVWEEMLSAYTVLLEQENELRSLEDRIGDPQVLADRALYRKVSDRYALLSEQFRITGGYTFRADTRAVLHGLKFLNNDFDRPISSLSGGQKTRLALARLLARKPDLLILDEPTNYLDMESSVWLEKYLQSYPGAILIVSHDRLFLDNVVGTIYELERGKTTRYTGNYTSFLKQKEQLFGQQMEEYKKQSHKQNQLAEFVQKNMARASTSGRAKAKLKQLNKMQSVEKPKSSVGKTRFSLDAGLASGSDVLNLQDIAVGYNGTVIANNINFDLSRGERVALLGPNGCGKTTLLKTIAGDLIPIHGDIRTGFNVEIAVYRQEQDFSGTTTVLDQLWNQYPDMDEQDVRGVLGRFLFHGEDVFKPTCDLSGGEKARLALAALLCKKANFLILDEPTNHLDYQGREALEDALLDYPGTLLLISHDRYFLKKLAQRVLELTANGTIDYPGGYDYYQDKRQDFQQKQAVETASKEDIKIGSAKSFYLETKEREKNERKRRRRINQLETLVHDTQSEIDLLEQELSQPDSSSEYHIYQEKGARLQDLQRLLDQYLEDWVSLEEEID